MATQTAQTALTTTQQTQAQNGLTGHEKAPALPRPPVISAYAWLLAWGMLIVILTLLNRTRLGHAVIYYSLALLIVFILLSNYRFIANALSPFQQQPAAVGDTGASPNDASVNNG